MSLVRNKICCRFLSFTQISKSISTSAKQFMQPCASTHPHLLKQKDVTFGLTVDVYKKRRTKLFELIAESSSRNSVHLVVVPSSTATYMSDDIPYFFRQNTDFSYLCGFKEPNCVLLLLSTTDSHGANHKSVILVTKPTVNSEKWEGPKMSLTEITNFLGVDKAVHTDELENQLSTFVKQYQNLILWYSPVHYCPNVQIQKKVQDFITSHARLLPVQSAKGLFHRLRLFKTEEEVELLRTSCQIAAESMKEVIRFSHPSILESHLHAKMDFECRLRGADFLAFPPVVAGGNRANTIHYLDNNQMIKDGEMVLMDAGCEYHGYSSDMSRTWPVNGYFNKSQKELYEAVLLIQEELIQLCQPPISLDDLFKLMCLKMGKYWKELGLIPKSASPEQASQLAYQLCPHHVSHYLGMDVHDTNQISRSIPLQPGMVVTVEPGIYVPKDKKDCPEEFRGVGIRIEDNVLITEAGNQVLTSACPKIVREIEEAWKS